MARKTEQDAGQAEAQKLSDEETDKGFSGIEVDPTPNENYTVKGVLAGAPVPETDADARAVALKASRSEP